MNDGVCRLCGRAGGPGRFCKRQSAKINRRTSRLRADGDAAVSFVLDYYINPCEEGRLRYRDYDWIATGRAPTAVYTYVAQTFVDMPREGHREFPDLD